MRIVPVSLVGNEWNGKVWQLPEEWGWGDSSSLFSHLCHKAKQVGHVSIMNILRTCVSDLRYDVLDPLNDPYYAGYIFTYF